MASTPLITHHKSSIFESQRSVFRKKKPFTTFVSKTLVTCKASNGKQNNGNNLDRRNVLLGLGGLYGATNLVTDPFALAAPINPNIFDCDQSFVDGKIDCINVPCCPPKPTKIIDFNLPKVHKIRYRPAAHLVDSDHLYKYELAMERMKALPEDDPRSFIQQANIHCAYCNGGYSQEGDPNRKIEIHYSWLFFPFHRLYLYFYEKILGKLIDDPDFTIPFWNWDSPGGMTIPHIFVDPNSPLYDSKRNPKHQPPNLVNLNDGKTFGPKKDDRFSELSKASQIQSNLCVMYREMVRNSKSASCFHGAEYHAGCSSTETNCTPEPRGGTIENGVHLAIHKFVGDPCETFNEDMGNFYSAGRDPVFYSHHANVDRMWNIWKELPGKKRRDFSDPDWLNSSFLFYDENGDMVRVKVWQALNSKHLGYDYDPKVDIQWLKSKPTPRKHRRHHSHNLGQFQDQAPVAKPNTIRYDFPIVLNETLRIKVPRPKKPMAKAGEEEKEEALILENIELNSNDSVQFGVCISLDENEKPCEPGDSEYIGDYKNIPHGTCKPMKLSTNKYLPIEEVLTDLDMTYEDSIVVTLEPTLGVGLVTIGNIKIDYIC